MLSVTFSGLEALNSDELTPFDSALEAFNCYLDAGHPVSRNGYRYASASAIGASGSIQAIRRFRPAHNSARTAVVANGSIYTLTDPSSETASDATVTLAGTVFSPSAQISMAQLGRYLYIGTDEEGVAMRRLNASYTLEALESLPTPAAPTYSLGSISVVVYRTLGLSYTTSTDLSLQTSGMPSGWYKARNATNTNNCLPGESVYFTLSADENWLGAEWVAFICYPHDTGNKDGALKISVAKQTGGSPDTFYEIGTIWDTPGQGGVPNIIYCSLLTLPESVRSAVRYVKFEIATGSSSSRYTFGVYGHCILPTAPSSSPTRYYTDLYSSSTQQASALSSALEVTIRDTDISLPSYVNAYLDRGVVRTAGSRIVVGSGNDRNFNHYAGLAYPKDKSELGLPITLSGTTPSGYTGTLTVRLWKDVENGRRLVDTQSGVSSGGAYSIRDYGGFRTLSNQQYRAGGTPPRCRALAARAQRLIAGYENRLYISSYIAPDVVSDPYPQFPAIALEDADGWSFDIAPSKAEQIQSLVNGDALYILTNLNCYSMTDMEPGSIPYHIFNRGCVGRHAAIFAENQLFWAGYDGVYTARNRVETQELTQSVRRLYTDWLGVGSDVVLGYLSRKLYVFRGVRFLRYDFVRGSWTRGEIAHTPLMCETWYDPGASSAQMWIAMSNRHCARWQSSATTDAGEPIPGWEYSTGFLFMGHPSRWRSVYVECDGGIEVTGHAGTTDMPSTRLSVRSGQSHTAAPPDMRSFSWRFSFKGSHGTSLFKVHVWMEALSAMGQADGDVGLRR